MIQLADQERRKLEELGVVALYLFGSRAQGIAGPLSDYDFAVLLRDAKAVNDTARFHDTLYSPMYDMLSDVVARDDAPPPPEGHFRNIDIVFLQRDGVSLHYPIHVMKYGVLLYDGDPRRRLRFEERARYLYMDFQPLRREAERVLLASL